MIDTLIGVFWTLGLSGEAAIPLLLSLVLILTFVRIINGSADAPNPIEFWHFFASYSERTQEERGDINNVGMAAGVVACLFTIMWVTYKANDINPWILGVCLIYLGGVKAFASWLRNTAGKRYGAPSTNGDDPPVKREASHSTPEATK